MSSAKIGSSHAHSSKSTRSSSESKPSGTRSSSESKPSGTRSSEPGSRAARPPGSRDEFVRPPGTSRSQVPLPGRVRETTPTLPKQLEPFREKLDNLAQKLASSPELMKDPVKLAAAALKGVKALEIPPEMVRAAVRYVVNQTKGQAAGREKFG